MRLENNIRQKLKTVHHLFFFLFPDIECGLSKLPKRDLIGKLPFLLLIQKKTGLVHYRIVMTDVS